MKRFNSRRRAAFTLIEVLLVLVILVVLASFAVTAYGPIQLQSKIRTARTQIGLLETPLENFRLNHGFFPPTLNLLWEQPADMTSAQWGGPYLKSPLPLDPWGREYLYEVYQDMDGVDYYRVWSVGPDGVSGTADDISN